MQENFSDIILSAAELCKLYGGNIVALDAPAAVQKTEAKKKPAKAQTTSTALTYLGHNERQVSFIIHSPAAGMPDEAAVAFMKKMLDACKMKLDDIALINANGQPVSVELLKKELSPSSVILFGVAPDQLGLPILFPEFKLQQHDNVTYLRVPDLSDLNQDNESGKLLKSKLWVCLRQLFQL